MPTNNYILTSNGCFYSEDEFYHHGIKGQKWGVRRYQNTDGSLTVAGKKRYWNKAPEGYSISHQVKEGELKYKINNEKDKDKKRQMKKEYKELRKLGEQKCKEYRLFEKDMHELVGKTSKIKVTENKDGTYTYTNKKGKTFEKWEVDGAWDYEQSAALRRVRRVYNATILGAFGALAVSTLGILND